MRILSVAALACAALSACSQKHIRPADVRPVHYENGRSGDGAVSGIRAALDEYSSKPVRAIIVHGMVTSETGYSDEIQEGIARRLKLKAVSREEIEIERGYDSFVALHSQSFARDGVDIYKSKLIRSSWANDTGDEALVFYELLWAPLRDEIKYEFVGCFESAALAKKFAERSPVPDKSCVIKSLARPNSDRRRRINGGLKDGLMIEGFADALIALGGVGDVLKEDLELAFCMIALDEMNTPGVAERRRGFGAPGRCAISQTEISDVLSLPVGSSRPRFFAITESLGSHFLFSAEIARGDRESIAAPSTAQLAMMDRATVYMLANQISVLSLSMLDIVCRQDEADAECPGTAAIPERKWENKEPTGSLATFVAFNDVNDVLGFELAPYVNEPGFGGRMVNVSVRNKAFGIPFLFKNPHGAHTNHRRNAAVIEAIVEGLPAASEGN